MKLIAIVIGLCLPVLHVRAQVDFAPLGAEWKYELWTDGSGWEPGWNGNCGAKHRILRVDKMIEVMGTQCSVIKQYHFPDYDPVNSNDSLILCSRSDTVFFYEDDRLWPLLLFDVEVGDTISTCRPHCSNALPLRGSPLRPRHPRFIRKWVDPFHVLK